MFLVERLKKKNAEHNKIPQINTNVDLDAHVIADNLASESYIKQRNDKKEGKPHSLEMGNVKRDM